MPEPSYNYSVDMLKKAAFHDEIVNVLTPKLESLPDISLQRVLIANMIDYLKNRIEDITTRYK